MQEMHLGKLIPTQVLVLLDKITGELTNEDLKQFEHLKCFISCLFHGN